MSCDHNLDAEYLYPSDAVVLELYDDPEVDTLGIRFALPCPDCDATLELTATVDHIGETELQPPIEEEDDIYD